MLLIYGTAVMVCIIFWVALMAIGLRTLFDIVRWLIVSPNGRVFSLIVTVIIAAYFATQH